MHEMPQQEEESDINQADPGSLPLELNILILQHVDMKQRLADCALACQAWHTAAVAATASIQRRSANSDKTEQLLRWLAQHGRQVNSLSLSAAYHNDQPALATGIFSCKQLKHLNLQHMSLQLIACSSSSGTNSQPQQMQCQASLADLSGLTHLTLRYCSAGDLNCLAGLTSLRQLQLECLYSTDKSWPAKYTTIPSCALSKLIHLTSLRLVKGVHDAVLQQLSCLSSLLDLDLPSCKSITAAGFVGLHNLQQLTWLRVDAAPMLMLSSSSSPSFSQLTALQRLELIATQGFDPMLLTHMRLLQHLDLMGSGILGEAAGTSALLAALPAMQQLRHLDLRGCLQHCIAPSAYAALTASSHLLHLSLSRCQLPPGAAGHMFATGRQLPALQQLLLSDSRTFDADDFAALAYSCPVLQELDISRAMQAGVQLVGLQQLSQLTSLAVCSVDDAAAAVLAQLTGLETLSVLWRSQISDCGVLHLTALKRLTQLWVHGDLSMDLAPGIIISLKTKATPADVWCQLLEACKRSAQCVAHLQMHQQQLEQEQEQEQASQELCRMCLHQHCDEQQRQDEDETSN